MAESIDHNNRLIVAVPSKTVSQNWIKGCLRLGEWSAVLTASNPVPDGHVSPADLKLPTDFSVTVGGYMVSDVPAIEYNSGMSRTYIIYFNSEEYVKRLGQRALELWAADFPVQQELNKDTRIRQLEKHIQAMHDEIEMLWKRQKF